MEKIKNKNLDKSKLQKTQGGLNARPVATKTTTTPLDHQPVCCWFLANNKHHGAEGKL